MDSTIPAASWPRRKGNSSLISPSMGHVSDTNAAGLDSHHDIARAGMGQSYLDEFNGSIGLARSDTTNGLRHEATFLTESPVAEGS